MEMSRKKRRRRRLLLIVPLLVLTGLVLLVELHLSPYIRELARNQAVNAASNAIIEAVSEMLRRTWRAISPRFAPTWRRSSA